MSENANIKVGSVEAGTTIDLVSSSAPSPIAGKGRMYFDSTLNKFQISENGNPFQGLGPSGTIAQQRHALEAANKSNAGIYEVTAWSTQNAAFALTWTSICWSPELGLFAAIASTDDGSQHNIMTSTNGVDWTLQFTPLQSTWASICWAPEIGKFVAVDVGSPHTIHSSDGITWTDSNITGANTWTSVCWSPTLGLLVAVAKTLSGRAMTSTDAISWLGQTAAELNSWQSVCWSPEKAIFCAVSSDGTHRVMTSPNGTAWTSQSAAEANSWTSVCWSPELNLFVAVATDGTHQVMTSPDGVAWSTASAATSGQWDSVCWAAEVGLFVAVSFDGLFMYSKNGINWYTVSIPEANEWTSICWAPEINLFVAVASNGTHRVMTSRRFNDVGTGAFGPQGATGADGFQGASGTNGTNGGVPMFASGTTGIAASPGEIATDSGLFSTATVWYVHQSDINSINLTSLLGAVKPGDYLQVTDALNGGYSSISIASATYDAGNSQYIFNVASHLLETGTINPTNPLQLEAYIKGAVGLISEISTQSGIDSNAGGTNTQAYGPQSMAVGFQCAAYGKASVVFGTPSGNTGLAVGDYSNSEGTSFAGTNYSHAEGGSFTGYTDVVSLSGTTATITGVDATSHFVNGGTVRFYSLSGGTNNAVFVADRTILTGPTFSGGNTTFTIGSSIDDRTAGSVTEIDTGLYSHAEGTSQAVGASSHSEGENTTATGEGSHSEGSITVASGLNSHAEGSNTTASGSYSHAEGNNTTAKTTGSHAQGTDAYISTNGTGWHAEANGSFATPGDAQYVRQILRAQTTDGSLHQILTPDEFWLTPDSNLETAYAITLTMFAKEQAGGSGGRAMWKRMLILETNTTNAYGNPTPIGTDIAVNGANTWSFTLAQGGSANFVIDISGAAGKNINWVALIEAVQISG